MPSSKLPFPGALALLALLSGVVRAADAPAVHEYLLHAGRFTALSASAELLAVASADGTVRLLDAAGGVVARLDGPAFAQALLAMRRRPAASVEPLSPAERERVFDRLHVPESLRESAEAEQLAEDEVTAADRQTPATTNGATVVVAAAGRHTALAVRGATAFICGQAGLFRWRAGVLESLVDGQDDAPPCDRLVAGPGDWLVGVRGAGLWVSRDDGHRFSLVATAAAAPTAVAVVAPGRLMWVAEGRLFAWTPARGAGPVSLPAETTADRGFEVLDVMGCGDDIVVLATAAVFVGADGDGAFARHPAPPARGLFCVGGAWLATGAVTPPFSWLSRDRGAGFAPVPGVRPLPPAALVAQATGLLARADTGILRLDLAPPVRVLDARACAATSACAAAAIAGPPRSPPGWTALLPDVSLAASVGDLGSGTRRRRELRTVLAAEFPLGLPAPAPPGTVAPPRAPSPGAGVPDPRAPACLAELRAAAVAHALADPARALSMVRRARRAAWLPELRLRVERRLGRNQSLDLDEALGLAPLGLDTVDDVRFEARATWDLGQLMWNPQELQAHVQVLRTADVRREIATTVNHLFFQRRKLLAPGAATDEPDATHLLRAAELDAELDALTGGALPSCR